MNKLECSIDKYLNSVLDDNDDVTIVSQVLKNLILRHADTLHLELNVTYTTKAYTVRLVDHNSPNAKVYSAEYKILENFINKAYKKFISIHEINFTFGGGMYIHISLSTQGIRVRETGFVLDQKNVHERRIDDR